MKAIDNVKLGLFVLIAVLGLVLLFYFVSKKNIWSSSIELRAQFRNIQGLQKGNNVRYGGMYIGTVKDIYLVNDTTVEVLMDVNGDMRNYIHKNALATILSDGFVGDKLVNISGGQGQSAPVASGDLIRSKVALDLDELMELVDSPEAGMRHVLTKVNRILQKVDESEAVWELTADKNLLGNIRQIMSDVQQSASGASHLIDQLNTTASNLNNGKGMIGAALTDTSYERKLEDLLNQSNDLTLRANKLLDQINKTVGTVDNDLNHGTGLAHALLKDSAMVTQIDKSLISLQKSASSFNEVMDALKSSFLLRKQIRRNQKAARRE